MKLYHNKVTDYLGVLPDGVPVSPGVFITLENGDKFYIDSNNAGDWEEVEDEATVFNIARMLKGAPDGYRMDSPVVGEVSLMAPTSAHIFVRYKEGGKKDMALQLDCYGRFNNAKGCQCVIFPKGKKTWFGFKPDWIKFPTHQKFKPLEEVLIPYTFNAETNEQKWVLAIYSHYDESIGKHLMAGGGKKVSNDKTILPYKGNESLLGQEIDKNRGW